jgi:hypothetical protein
MALDAGHPCTPGDAGTVGDLPVRQIRPQIRKPQRRGAGRGALVAGGLPGAAPRSQPAVGADSKRIPQPTNDVDGRVEFVGDAEAVLTVHVAVGEVAGKLRKPKPACPCLEGPLVWAEQGESLSSRFPPMPALRTARGLPAATRRSASSSGYRLLASTVDPKPSVIESPKATTALPRCRPSMSTPVRECQEREVLVNAAPRPTPAAVRALSRAPAAPGP